MAEKLFHAEEIITNIYKHTDIKYRNSGFKNIKN